MRNRKLFGSVAMTLSIAMLLTSLLGTVVAFAEEASSSSSSSDEVVTIVVLPDSTSSGASGTTVQGGTASSPSGYGNASNLGYWQGINSDIKAWLRVPGTNINYPVAYHNDIMYYNARGYYKEASRNGVLWTNPHTSFGSSSQISRNTVIYGHNWTNYSANPRVGNPGDVMFGQLTAYHHLWFAQANPNVYYTTDSGTMTFKIFAVFYTEPAFQYNGNGIGSGTVNEAMLRSRYNFNVDVNDSDKLITLSTCTRAYGATANQRFVVMARLLRPGESTGNSNITSNPNHKQPKVW